MYVSLYVCLYVSITLKLSTEFIRINMNNSATMVRSVGGIVSKETVCCVGGKVKH